MVVPHSFSKLSAQRQRLDLEQLRIQKQMAEGGSVSSCIQAVLSPTHAKHKMLRRGSVGGAAELLISREELLQFSKEIPRRFGAANIQGLVFTESYH